MISNKNNFLCKLAFTEKNKSILKIEIPKPKLKQNNIVHFIYKSEMYAYKLHILNYIHADLKGGPYRNKASVAD